MKKRSKIIIACALIFVFFWAEGSSNYGISQTKNLYQKIQVFNAVLNTIESVYVEEVNPTSLIDDAIRGMIKNLDPHTTYLTAEEFKNWSKTYQGYSGIGISFDIIKNKITIMSVMEGGPSHKLGLLPGDRIIEINGESAIGIKRNDVPKKLMGPPGTTVRVTVERQGWDKPKEFTIVRQKIEVESIPQATFLRPGLGYIRIARFSRTTGQELETALTNLEAQGLEKLILDLRGNSGGYLQMAVEVANKFIPGGKMIVYTKGRIPAAYREYFASPQGVHPMFPLIVLVDHTSASASEIVAGAIQDWDRGLIVGQTTFGKGLVQTQYPFSDGSVLLITTAKYYTPSGRLIQRDFSHKSWEDYYREAYNDSLRQQQLAKLPKFKTFAGRTVYGGGGIAPDIWLTSNEKPPSKFTIDLIYDEQRFFYTFAEEFLKNNPQIRQMDVIDFAQNYQLPPETLDNFAEYVMKIKPEISKEKFQQNAKDIRFLLKRQIAYIVWGKDGQFQVNLTRDSVLQKAMDYFPEAAKLLTISTLNKRK